MSTIPELVKSNNIEEIEKIIFQYEQKIKNLSSEEIKNNGITHPIKDLTKAEYPPLLYAKTAEMVKYLVSRGDDIHYKYISSNHESNILDLMLYLESDNIDAIEALVKLGVDTNKSYIRYDDQKNITTTEPLIFTAIDRADVELFEILMVNRISLETEELRTNFERNFLYKLQKAVELSNNQLKSGYGQIDPKLKKNAKNILKIVLITIQNAAPDSISENLILFREKNESILENTANLVFTSMEYTIGLICAKLAMGIYPKERKHYLTEFQENIIKAKEYAKQLEFKKSLAPTERISTDLYRNLGRSRIDIDTQKNIPPLPAEIVDRIRMNLSNVDLSEKDKQAQIDFANSGSIQGDNARDYYQNLVRYKNQTESDRAR